MARKYAQIKASIWSDEHFKSLPGHAQHMYFVLLSQPRINLCGVLDYLPHRLAGCCYEWTTDDVHAGVKTLSDERFVIVDYDSGEMLIRSFIRNDGLLKMPNVSKGMAADYGEIMSERLRKEIDFELTRAYREEPELAAWDAIKDVNPPLLNRVIGAVQ